MSENKRFEIRIAGFGGQGVVTIGKVLGSAFTIYEGINSVNTRSYGPESRGSACRSEVVVSRGEIHYPSVRRADVLVALSQTALDKYIGDLKEEGILLIDPNSVKMCLKIFYPMKSQRWKLPKRWEISSSRTRLCLGRLLHF